LKIEKAPSAGTALPAFFQFSIFNFQFPSENAMAATREIITLQCTECKRRNYTTTKNKKTTTEKLELKKFCRHDRKRTVHRETK
jgi:large subunit ribosomal protein L33